MDFYMFVSFWMQNTKLAGSNRILRRSVSIFIRAATSAAIFQAVRALAASRGGFSAPWPAAGYAPGFRITRGLEIDVKNS
jgi:stage V sporulation protein SpoVS